MDTLGEKYCVAGWGTEKFRSKMRVDKLFVVYLRNSND